MFRRVKIDDGTYEAAAVFDVDGDGVLDIVCGAYWYKGPNFTEKYKICDIKSEGEYWDDFSDYPLDVNGDGKPDVITGAWWGETLRWRENPGVAGAAWITHDVEHIGSIETIRYCDIDGCGTVEIFPNTPGQPQMFFKLNKDASGKGNGTFTKYVISEGASGHGMGFADVNGNGRTDVILSKGWLECPQNPLTDKWIWHEEFDFPMACVPILGYDVTGNGLTDIIVGCGHNYGLWWYEQVITDGKREWVKHTIDDARAQYHDMQLVDIDGDGELELLTGKRYRAHCGNDPGDNDPVFVCYFKINGGKFDRVTLDEGPVADGHSGVGIYFWTADLTGNGKLDIVCPGKEGLYIFYNQ